MTRTYTMDEPDTRNRLDHMEPPRDLVQRPLGLSQQAHDATEGFGHRLPLAAQPRELDLERAEVTAEVVELALEPLALALFRLERLAHVISLLDQRRDRGAEHLLALRDPPRNPLRISENVLFAHLHWCLLGGNAGLLCRTRGLGRVFPRELDELVRRPGGEPRPTAAALDGWRPSGRDQVADAAPVDHHPDPRIASMARA